jgi:hypothetical protein
MARGGRAKSGGTKRAPSGTIWRLMGSENDSVNAEAMLDRVSWFGWRTAAAN